jgi:hypothetical protein
MAKGRTLWEMFTGKKDPPVEEQYFNPIRAKIGNAVAINDLDLKSYDFLVREIRQYQRTIEGQQFLFADYVLRAQPLKGNEVVLRLRVNPAAKDVAGLTHTVLVLRLYDELAYDKDFHGVVTDTTKKIEVTEDGLTQTYWRINDVQSSYLAQVAVISDVNQDGKVEEEEVRKLQIEYWDYWRETLDEAGSKVVQFLFVEMDKESGWFQLWRGEEINPQRVMVI